MDKKKLSIAETKKSLPVFPFREDLIEAVKEHQVSQSNIGTKHSGFKIVGLHDVARSI